MSNLEHFYHLLIVLALLALLLLVTDISNKIHTDLNNIADQLEIDLSINE